jgi:hypothetical protein
LRLRPTIVVLFVLLTAPVYATIIGLTYLSNRSIARANAEALIERFRGERGRQHPEHVCADQDAGAQRRDDRQPAARFLFRQLVAGEGLEPPTLGL